MSIISPVGSNTSTVIGDRQKATTAASVTDKTATVGKSVNADTSSSDKSTIELSTRAQKIQKLNAEFFPAGPQSLIITTAFIERLEEYGFLNAGEAQKLSSAAAATSSTSGQSAQPLGELSTFIDGLTDELKGSDLGNSLISVLQKAQLVINNLDGSNPPSTVIDIKTIFAELEQFTSSDEMHSLSNNDKRSLQQLELALQVADKLGPEDSSSEKINKYLSILNQSI